MGIVQLALGDTDSRLAFAHLVMSGEAGHAETADLELMAYALGGSQTEDETAEDGVVRRFFRPRSD